MKPEFMMIFKPCSNCGKNLTAGNVERVEMDELGLWLHHSECKGSSIIALAEVVRRSNEFAGGNVFKQLEIDYYKNRVKELQERKK